MTYKKNLCVLCGLCAKFISHKGLSRGSGRKVHKERKKKRFQLTALDAIYGMGT